MPTCEKPPRMQRRTCGGSPFVTQCRLKLARLWPVPRRGVDRDFDATVRLTTGLGVIRGYRLHFALADGADPARADALHGQKARSRIGTTKRQVLIVLGGSA